MHIMHVGWAQNNYWSLLNLSGLKLSINDIVHYGWKFQNGLKCIVLKLQAPINSFKIILIFKMSEIYVIRFWNSYAKSRTIEVCIIKFWSWNKTFNLKFGASKCLP